MVKVLMVGDLFGPEHQKLFFFFLFFLGVAYFFLLLFLGVAYFFIFSLVWTTFPPFFFADTPTPAVYPTLKPLSQKSHF